MQAAILRKFSQPLNLLRRLGLAYVAMSAGMFLFGFVSTLIVKLS